MGLPVVLTHIIVPTLGVIVTNIMWSSPLKIIWEARRSRDLGSINPLPSVAVLCNCIGWFVYGLMKRDYFLFFSNAPGIFIGLFSTVTAMSIMAQNTKPYEALPEKYVQLECLLIFAFVFWCTMTLVAVNAFNNFDDPLAQMEMLVGILSSFFAVCYYAAPLSTMIEVIRTKDASSMYGPMILCNLVNSFLWTSYGFALLDPNLIIPNALGVALAVLQLFILSLYYKKVLPGEDSSKSSALTKSELDSSIAPNPLRNEHFDDYLSEDGALENYSKSSKERFHIR